MKFRDEGLLGGAWDLVITYNWAYNPDYNPLTGLVKFTPIISRVIIRAVI